MATENSSMLNDFKNILADAQGSGVRVLESWLRDPEKFLRKSKYSLPIDDVLRGLTNEEREKLLPIAQFAVNTSIFYLLKYLEEGEAGYSFSLAMQNDQTGSQETIIGPVVNNQLAESIER